MQPRRSNSPVFLAALVAVLLAVTSLFAQPGYTLTGSGVRVKTVAFIDVDVYRISHYMKQLPATKSKQAVIEMETGKKFVWTMLRDVDRDNIVKALRDAYAMNGYSDAAKISRFLAAFKGELKEGSTVTIEYDPEKKATTLTVNGGGAATVAGVDFMRATWRIWFGKIDQPKLSDALLAKIP